MREGFLAAGKDPSPCSRQAFPEILSTPLPAGHSFPVACFPILQPLLSWRSQLIFQGLAQLISLALPLLWLFLLSLLCRLCPSLPPLKLGFPGAVLSPLPSLAHSGASWHPLVFHKITVTLHLQPGLPAS